MAEKKEKRAYGISTKRTNVTLSDSERQFLREIGGNVSNGIRVLIIEQKRLIALSNLQ